MSISITTFKVGTGAPGRTTRSKDAPCFPSPSQDSLARSRLRVRVRVRTAPWEQRHGAAAVGCCDGLVSSGTDGLRVEVVDV